VFGPSAVLKPQSKGLGAGIYLKRKPDSESDAQIAGAVLEKIRKPNLNEAPSHNARRSREPAIDKDMKIYLKERPDIIESLLSRKRYWISRWKRRIRS
jgi:hypothetical protein